MWMSRAKYALTWMLLIFTLTGCGFHLRGTTYFPPKFNHLAILNEDGSVNKILVMALEAQFKINHVKAQTYPEGAKYLLLLKQENVNQQMIHVAAATTPRQYILTYTVIFQLVAANGVPITEAQSISTQRETTLNLNRILGSDYETNTILHEMMQDIASQILTRIGSQPLP